MVDNLPEEDVKCKNFLAKEEMHEILYLSAADVAGLELSAPMVAAAVELMFRLKSLGRALMKPKISLNPGPHSVVEALIGADTESQSAAVKWVSVSTENAHVGLPGVQALIVLSETRNGRARAIMNASWITGARTAGCTAVAARYLASPASSSAGFVGAGAQARTHLEALRFAFPSLHRIAVYTRSASSADDFIAFARARGIDGRRIDDPREAVEGHDIVVTTVPPAADLKPFIDPRWLSPGTFVSAVDLGRSWMPEHWPATFDVIATDDRAQSEDRARSGKMLDSGRFDAELGDLALGRHPGRSEGGQRTAFVFAGTALADLAVARLVVEEALKRGLGTLLPV